MIPRKELKATGLAVRDPLVGTYTDTSQTQENAMQPRILFADSARWLLIKRTIAHVGLPGLKQSLFYQARK